VGPMASLDVLRKLKKKSFPCLDSKSASFNGSLIAILSEPCRLLIDYSSNEKILNSSVTALTRLWHVRSDNRVPILDRDRELNLPHRFQTGTGAHRAACQFVPTGPFLTDKVEVDCGFIA
jgi:hypothetical protein